MSPTEQPTPMDVDPKKVDEKVDEKTEMVIFIFFV